MSDAPEIIVELVDKFHRNLKAYKNPNYKEEQLKQEFINRPKKTRRFSCFKN